MNSAPTSPCRKDSSATLTPTFIKHCSDEEEETAKCCSLKSIRNCCLSPFHRQRDFKLKNTCLGTNHVQKIQKYIHERGGTTEGEDEEDNKIIQTCDDIRKQTTDPCNYR